MSKIRLDQYLCQNGLVQSRERAKALIMSGIVFVDEQKVDKAGEMINPDAKVEVRGHDIGYVSRGGLKLEKAMQVFPMRPDGKVCMDIGASTGGFTDCMLQNGAVKVYAVDVGYGQLAWSLRTDERVVNMERTNIRNVKPEDLSEPVAFFSVDVSFISLKHIFPVADAITTPDAVGVCLVKPQFEAGREKVGKKGVVREPATHREVLEMAQGYAMANHFTPAGLDFSPIKGPEGNIEFLGHLTLADVPGIQPDTADVVAQAIDGGATFVQLREKCLDEHDLLAEAEELSALCHARHVPFVIDDNVEIALAAGADGVHVGQSDMAAKRARALLGPDKILGVSAHNAAEALAAQADGADYLGCGAAFVTGTKLDAHPVTAETMRAVTAAVNIPVVAIGGIDAANLLQLQGRGLAGVAVVSAIFAQADPCAASRELYRLAGQL